jgi:peptidoglycan/LPS O-acetylase OafA/YrhL
VPQVRSYSLRIGLPFLGKVIASFGFAAASYYLIERPFLQLKRRFAIVDAGPAERRLPRLARHQLSVSP